MVVIGRAPMTAVAGPASSASVDASGLGLEVPDGPASPVGAAVMEPELLHAARAAARLETAMIFEDRILMIPYSKFRVEIQGVKGRRRGSSADEGHGEVVRASTGVSNVGQA